MKLQEIKSQFLSVVDEMRSTADVEALRVRFLGKKGYVTAQYKELKNLSPEEKKVFGSQVNELRDYITEVIKSKYKEVAGQELQAKLENETIDITLPCREYTRGKIHPISQAISEVQDIFGNMGFQMVDGPDIEDDWHNFTALNIPTFHPARQMQDTFYLSDNSLLLRTHTSPVQIRHMSHYDAPHRIMTIGKVYRADYDATHTPMFHQVEALYVGKHVDMTQLKYCIKRFLKEFFGLDIVPLRWRPSYFPFTEPSAEVDIKCLRQAESIDIGKGHEWLEVLGCGMVHPKVLDNVGIDSQVYKGFALGAGIERLAMLKYGISDLRSFFDGDLRWNKYYGF